MNFQEDPQLQQRPPLAVGPVHPAFQRNQPSQARQEEAALLKHLHQARSEPGVLAVRHLLEVRLLRCQSQLVKAALNDVALLQGEARTLQKLLSDLSGERATIE